MNNNIKTRGGKGPSRRPIQNIGEKKTVITVNTARAPASLTAKGGSGNFIQNNPLVLHLVNQKCKKLIS
jgi:hypothetical protein